MFSFKILVAIVLITWLYYLWTRRKFYALIFKIPGPLGYPFIGMAHALIKREEILETFRVNIKKYGPTFFSWLGPFPFLVIGDPELAQDILTSPDCINKGFIYQAIDDGTGKGLFSLKNPQWSTHRKLINPAFGHRVLLSFMPVFNKEVDILLRNIEQNEKNDVDLTKEMQKMTLNIAAQTTMGTTIVPETSIRDENLLNSFQCIRETMAEMCFSPWLSFKVIQLLLGKYFTYSHAKKDIRYFIRNLIQKKLDNNHIEIRNDDKKEKNIFINLAIDLLKRGEFSMQNVEDESNVIVFGAFETTANTVNYTLMLLSMFPIYQQKAFEEILSIFPDRGEFEVTYADAQQMVYMDLILNETMRIMAPVPLISRQTSNDVKLSNGVVIPKGVQIAIDIFHMHRREDIWGTDAHIFNPDNFLPSNLDGKHPYAYIPFTKGIRNCIGWRYALLSTKIVLAKLMRNYRFTTNFNFQDLHFVEDITIKLKKNPLLVIHKRDS